MSESINQLTLVYGEDELKTDEITFGITYDNYTYGSVNLSGRIRVYIDNINQSSLVEFSSFKISDYITQRINICKFKLITPNTYIPEVGLEVLVIEGSTKLFGGYITSREVKRINDNRVEYNITCQDYTLLLYHRRAVETYENKTCYYIINDLVTKYCSGYGLDVTNVETGATLDRIQFNYMYIGDCIKKICKYTGYDWYVDYDKKIYFFDAISNAAAFDITDSSAVSDLKVKRDLSKVRNRIFVRGGSYLSDSYTQYETGDGTLKSFNLNYKPHDITCTVDGVSQAIGTGYIDEDDLGTTYDALVYFEEKVLKFYTAPGSGVAVNITYKYEIPVLIRRQELSSIGALKALGDVDGIREKYIVDNSLKTKEEARDRADFELEKYANPKWTASYNTRTPGLKSGTIQNINSTLLGVNEDFIITSVVIQIKPNGKHIYNVVLEGRLYGLTELLLDLLDKSDVLADREDEVLDKIQVLTEQVNVSDSHTKTSTAPPFKWGSFKWDFGQWG